MGYRDYSTAKGLIVDASGHGDFTSISSAIAAASSGHTIFVRPGTYTENPTGKAGVDITAFIADAYEPNVTINGTFTFSANGSTSMSGINFQTNSSYAFAVTGSNPSFVALNNCLFTCTNNTGIEFSSSNASAEIQMYNCGGVLDITGIALYTMSSPGTFVITDLSFGNENNSTISSNNSAGTVFIFRSNINIPFSSSSTGALAAQYCYINTAGGNSTGLTFNGTGGGNVCEFSRIISGSASAISIGVGVLCTVTHSVINSSNTNAVTGSGTLNAGLITFEGTSSTINTSTVNKLITYGGTIV
jgi:hypothetical protein